MDFNSKQARAERIRWFQHDRFGMFIHWGLYAIPARGEWLRYYERVDDEHYEPYFREFNPVKYDPRQWARIAKAAGMKYAVLTAKHHDGFCLFDSAQTDFKSTNTPCGRDLVREFVEAFRAEGLKVGLYFSLLDWHHPDFPEFDGIIHTDEYLKKNPRKGYDNYLKFMHAQIEELLTNYGHLDIMWFDYSYGEMCGEKWGASHIIEMVRKYQPHLITDNRLEGAGGSAGSILSANPTPFSGDFMCPEGLVPFECPRNELGEPVPWESCMTLNNHWGYCGTDFAYKSARDLVRDLSDCVSKSGNFLLNVGPDALGRIPAPAERVLREVGGWLDENGDSIYGCGMSDVKYPDFGRYTQSGNKLYLHLYEKCNRPIRLCGLLDKIESIRLLRDGSEVKLLDPNSFHGPIYREYPGDAFFFMGGRSEELPDPWDTVIEIALKD